MRRRLGLGIFLIIVGVVFGLQRMGLITMVAASHVFPVLLIALGLVRLAVPHERCRFGGLWLIVWGGIWLLSQLHVVWSYQIWPALLVLAGLSIVLKHFFGGSHGPREQGLVQ